MPLTAIASLPLFQFANLSRQGRVVHAISTRRGGVSRPPWDTLNLSYTKGDDPNAVTENQRRLCNAVSVERDALVTAYQVHGRRVVTVAAAARGHMQQTCDGLATNLTDLPLMLRFADCTPLLLYDPRHHALALVHAGWRGTIAGIARAALDAMTASFGTRPQDVIAGIGPAIGSCCYEVGDEVSGAVYAALPEPETLLHAGPRGRWHFDLWAANAQQLRAGGVVDIEIAGICTACHPQWFFSHRAEQGRCGHFGALAMLQPEVV